MCCASPAQTGGCHATTTPLPFRWKVTCKAPLECIGAMSPHPSVGGASCPSAGWASLRPAGPGLLTQALQRSSYLSGAPHHRLDGHPLGLSPAPLWTGGPCVCTLCQAPCLGCPLAPQASNIACQGSSPPAAYLLPAKPQPLPMLCSKALQTNSPGQPTHTTAD